MRISSAELVRNFGKYSDHALNEPVVITKNGRDRLVLLSVEEYDFLRDMVTNTPTQAEPQASAKAVSKGRSRR